MIPQLTLQQHCLEQLNQHLNEDKAFEAVKSTLASPGHDAFLARRNFAILNDFNPTIEEGCQL